MKIWQPQIIGYLILVLILIGNPPNIILLNGQQEKNNAFLTKSFEWNNIGTNYASSKNNRNPWPKEHLKRDFMDSEKSSCFWIWSCSIKVNYKNWFWWGVRTPCWKRMDFLRKIGQPLSSHIYKKHENLLYHMARNPKVLFIYLKFSL